MKSLKNITEEELRELNLIPTGWQFFKSLENYNTDERYGAKIRKPYEYGSMRINEDGYEYQTIGIALDTKMTIAQVQTLIKLGYIDNIYLTNKVDDSKVINKILGAVTLYASQTPRKNRKLTDLVNIISNA